MEEYTTRELTDDEAKVLAEELQAVLEKYNAEMGVTSAIRLLKREPITHGTDANKEEQAAETSPETSESGEGDSEKPAEG